MTDESKQPADQSVLVVEDDELIARLLKASLVDVGYDVQTAVHGDVLPLAHDQPET